MYKYSDGGKCCSKRPKQTNDCVVRALAIALNKNYDTVYDLLASNGRKCSRGTPHKAFYPMLDECSLYSESFQAVNYPSLKARAS